MVTCGRADRRQCFGNEMDRRRRCLVCSVFSINHFITMDYLFHSPDVFMQGSDVFHSALPCVHLGSRNGGDIWRPPSKRSIRSWRALPLKRRSGQVLIDNGFLPPSARGARKRMDGALRRFVVTPEAFFSREVLSPADFEMGLQASIAHRKPMLKFLYQGSKPSRAEHLRLSSI